MKKNIAGKFQYKILLVTGMIWSADAIELMILTFLLPILTEEWDLQQGEDGTIGAIGIYICLYLYSIQLYSIHEIKYNQYTVFAGMLIGAIFWPQISDRYGRRWAVIISNTGQIIFGMLSATAWDMYSMMVLRFLTGFCLGASSCGFTLYAEYAPKSDRGKLLVLQQSFWAFGTFFNSLLAWLILETLDWRWYLILSSLPLCIIVYLAWKLPESVQYLVTVGRKDEAEEILRGAARINNKSSQIGNLDDLRLSSQQIVHNKRGNPMEIFDVKYYSTTITCLIIMFAVTFAYYGVSFLSERFFDRISSDNDQDDSEKYWKIAVTTSAEIPGVLVGMLTLDKIGRKRSMIIYFGIVTVCMLMLVDEGLQNIEALSVTLVFLGRGAASISFFVIYIYLSEYYPTQIRNTSVGFAAALSRLSGMATTYVSQSDNITYAFYLYGLASFAACVASVSLEGDTTGIDLSAIGRDKMRYNNNKDGLLKLVESTPEERCE